MGPFATLTELRFANLARQKEVFPMCEDWEPRDWALAIAGEVGELCNLLKKAKRDSSDDEDLFNVAREIADIVIYCDLLAASLGLELDRWVTQKFNEVSKRRGSHISL